MLLRRFPSLAAVALALLLPSGAAGFPAPPGEPSNRPAPSAQLGEEATAESQPQEGDTGEVRSEETEPQEAESQQPESAQPESEEAPSEEAKSEESPAAETGSTGGETETNPAGEEASGPPPAEEPAVEPEETAAESQETGEAPQESGEEGEEQTAPEPQHERATREAAEAESEPESELSPEEQAKLEELKRKREAIAAKRAEKKARQAEKQEQKRLAEEAKHAERLDVVLAKGYEALQAGKLEAARQAFEKHMELHGGDSYGGHLGLARVELARDNQAAAIEQALKAAKATSEGAEKAEALTFAAETTLAARPRAEASGAPLPGTELFLNNALRYYMQALIADPEGASEARDALEEAFPTPEDERTERFYDRFLESSEAAPQQYAKRLAATYEALLSGRVQGPLAVAGGITPPEKISGTRPPYPQNPEAASVRRRLVIGLTVEADGTVANARVLNGIDPKLDRGAETAMREWTFEPAQLPNGTPVEVYYVLVTNADIDPLEPAVAEETSEATGEEGTEEETGRATPARGRTAEPTATEGEPAERENARRERGEAATNETTETTTETATETAEASAETPPEDSAPQTGESPPDKPESEDDQ